MRDNNFNYSPIRATSRIDGTPAQTILNMYDEKAPDKNKLFGLQGGFSQNRTALFVDCKCSLTMDQRILIEPRLAELRFKDGLFNFNSDRPKYLTKRKNDYTQDEAFAIINKRGASGQTWSMPIPL